MKKNNTWNIRRLVDDLFVPSSKQPSVLYCKLTDFKSCYIFSKKQLKAAQNGYCFTPLEYYNVSNFCGNANLPLNEEGEKEENR